MLPKSLIMNKDNDETNIKSKENDNNIVKNIVKSNYFQDSPQKEIKDHKNTINHNRTQSIVDSSYSKQFYNN